MGSIFFWGITLMAIWGKVEVTLDNTGGHVFTGVGTFGRIKHFAWDDVATVRESISGTSYPGSQGSVILLEGKNRMVRALKSILVNVKKTNRLQ